MFGSKQKKDTEGWRYMTSFPPPNITSDDQIIKYKMGEACGRLGRED